MNDYGYTTSVVAKLVQVEATTSLAYRPLVEAEELGVSETILFIFTQDVLYKNVVTLGVVTQPPETEARE